MKENIFSTWYHVCWLLPTSLSHSHNEESNHRARLHPHGQINLLWKKSPNTSSCVYLSASEDYIRPDCQTYRNIGSALKTKSRPSTSHCRMEKSAGTHVLSYPLQQGLLTMLCSNEGQFQKPSLSNQTIHSNTWMYLLHHNLWDMEVGGQTGVWEETFCHSGVFAYAKCLGAVSTGYKGFFFIF